VPLLNRLDIIVPVLIDRTVSVEDDKFGVQCAVSLFIKYKKQPQKLLQQQAFSRPEEPNCDLSA
jgi:hypothetical protein